MLGKSLCILLLCLGVHMTWAKDCGYPNGTATAFHYYNCDTSLVTSSSAFQITDKTGKLVYPVHIFDANVHQTIENAGSQYDALLVDVTISQYKNTILKPECHWSALPTFGMTSNLDWCEQSHACPLKKGSNKMTYLLDLSKFKSIIDLLSETPAYELRFNLHTKDKTKVGCLAVQTKILKKSD